MRCPVCDETLRGVQKHGVNVDICPGCKGVWLDRGELEKVIEMAAAGGPGRETGDDYAGSGRRGDEVRRPSGDRDDDRDYRERRDHDEHSYVHPHKKKKGSWLGEIFEGFGGD